MNDRSVNNTGTSSQQDEDSKCDCACPGATAKLTAEDAHSQENESNTADHVTLFPNQAYGATSASERKDHDYDYVDVSTFEDRKLAFEITSPKGDKDDYYY